ncbi:MAG TPA: hypothetical protein PKE21_05370 [Flavobacteriales bacterium]|nr:hypothetical protein [Flavobacteriales bacterium]HMR26890.1 hypothetical protein [Flavobacteriales bacterium]
MKIKNGTPGVLALKPGQAGVMERMDGTTANYGVIRLEPDALVHYTGQGLRVMWKPDMSAEEKVEADRLKAMLKEQDGEQRLMAMGHIEVTALSRIRSIW